MSTLHTFDHPVNLSGHVRLSSLIGVTLLLVVGPWRRETHRWCELCCEFLATRHPGRAQEPQRRCPGQRVGSTTCRIRVPSRTALQAGGQGFDSPPLHLVSLGSITVCALGPFWAPPNRKAAGPSRGRKLQPKHIGSSRGDRQGVPHELKPGVEFSPCVELHEHSIAS